MKKLIYLFLLTGHLVCSQTGVIEIGVRDSVHLKPLTFEYNVKVSENLYLSYTAEPTINQDAIKIKMREKLSELETFLNSRNHTIRPLNNSEYEIQDNASFYNLGFAVTLSTSEELEQLTTALKKLDFINANIGHIMFDENSAWERRLVEKLIAKAKLKGQMIADLTGQKLGKIIEFSESGFVEDQTLSFKDIYFAASMGLGKNWSVERNMIFGNRWKTAVFKFETQ